VKDGEAVRVGPLALTAHYTGGHTPGGTTWSWQSCESKKCLEIEYADSQTPVSADSFFFTKSREYPTGIQDFEHGQAVLESMRCNILITPHPGASQMWERLARPDGGLIDSTACKRYAKNAREQLAKRLLEERQMR
jgi:metallo-beta-lactamase class B